MLNIIMFYHYPNYKNNQLKMITSKKKNLE